MGQLQSWMAAPWASGALLERRATATILQRGGSIGRFNVQNLSAGGAVLTGAHDVRSSAPLRLLLELPSGDSLTVGAHVRHREIAGDLVALAVAFRHLHPTSEDRIQDAMLALIDRTHRAENPAVMIVERSTTIRADLLERVGLLGRRTLAAEAPLTALRLLDDVHEHVDAVLVRDSPYSTVARELLEFVAEQYRGVRSILLVDEDFQGGMTREDRVLRCRPDRLPDVLG